MKYFTPELYVQGNSSDPDAVDWVEEEWERALKRYRRHYKKIEGQLPESVRYFHDHHCLHDADIFAPAWLSPQTMPWNFQNVVIVVQNINTLLPEYKNTLMFLQYAVTAEPVIDTPLHSDAFNKVQPIWLYDEIDVVEPGVFSHEIFVSDGRVIRLTFREFQMQVAKLVSPSQAVANGVLDSLSGKTALV